MKSIYKLLYLSLFFIVFIACQKEVSEIIQQPTEEVLKANTAVTTLIKKTVTNDGSKDNIIDNASCFNVQLPVTVKANGLEINIDSGEGFNVIEAIFDEFDDDSDALEIFFPIVITLSDYTEVSIRNHDELENFIKECGGENEVDDDIECLDFVYPITLSIYDTANQLTKNITVEKDQQFFKIIEEIEDYHLVVVNFPITVVLFDGTEKVIDNMEALENIIEDVKDTCDEDDDNDYEDDDCNDCTEQQLKELLIACSWKVDKIKINDIENTEQYTSYTFWFIVDGTFKAEESGNFLYGTWEIDLSENNNIFVKLNIDDLSDFSFNWVLYEIENDSELDLRFEDNLLELEKTCIEDKIELVNILNEGSWLVANFNDKGVNKTSIYNDFLLDFKDDFTLAAIKGGDLVNGTWEVVYDSGNLKLTLDFDENTLFDSFNEDWKIEEDTQNKRIALNDVDSDTGGESNLVLESN